MNGGSSDIVDAANTRFVADSQFVEHGLFSHLKTLHMTLAAVSITGFVFRWFATINGRGWVSSRPARILPHLVDTVFLATGIALAFLIQQYPFRSWLVDGQSDWPGDLYRAGICRNESRRRNPCT